jgi:hypothetical protein
VDLAAYLPIVILLIQFTPAGAGADRCGAEPTQPGPNLSPSRRDASPALAFVYYVSFDIARALSRNSVLPLAALIYAACMLGSVRGAAGRAPQRDLTAVAAAGGLAAVGILIALLQPAAAPAPQTAAAIGRVMTFNVHSAFNRQGRLDPQEIARLIDAQDPDVVALQEVSRGWLIDGSVDLVDWLATRLGMEVVFAGTAIRSGVRHPQPRRILDHGSASPAETRPPAMSGRMSTRPDRRCSSSPRTSITSPRSPACDCPDPRADGILPPTIPSSWRLNSEPTWPEMELILNAGMVDA